MSEVKGAEKSHEKVTLRPVRASNSSHQVSITIQDVKNKMNIICKGSNRMYLARIQLCKPLRFP